MPKIELILKSPTDRVAPFSVNAETLWNIKELKIHISSVYPCKPKLETQKLIYSGKLLKDEQVLNDIFEADKSAVVHFICQPSGVSDSIKSKDLDDKNETNEVNPDLLKEYQNYLNEFYSSSMQSFTSMDQYQQMAWLNHAYMQSYANYYEQWNNMSESNIQSNTSTEVVQRTVTNETAPNQENPPNNERRIEPAGDNGLPNMMAAAFGGLMGDGGEDENDGDVEPRDLLHYFYMFIRFGLLLLICYYYSSMFSVVTTIFLFFLFFLVNFFRRNHHVNQQIPIPPRTEDVPVQPVALTTDTDNADNNAPVPPLENSRVPDAIPGMTDRLRRAASTSFQFVLTFFITLFPDPVAHINVN